MRQLSIAVLALTCVASVVSSAQAPPDSSLHVSFGGFVDSYFAYDFGRPPTLDRAFTTQPARHDEFNVNLAFIEAVLGAERIRGRLAIQYGTSVQANYFGEPRVGTISGPDVARFVQEGTVGVRLARALWIDGGIFFANAGMEGWISRDNPTYTRSLVADFSPYYSSGVKLTWQVTPMVTARFDVINGWQNISETNTDKAVGARLDVTPAAGWTASYYNFFGNELSGRLRTYNGVGLKGGRGSASLLAEVDVGTQARDGNRGTASWWGYTLIGRLQINPRAAFAGRIERFDDPEGVILNSGITDARGYVPFRANGASLGFDFAAQTRVLWRTELRALHGQRAVFPSRDRDTGLSRTNAFVVTSLALTL